MNKLTDYFTQLTENLKREIVGVSGLSPGSYNPNDAPFGTTPPGLGSLGSELARGSVLHSFNPQPPPRPSTPRMQYVLSPPDENGSHGGGGGGSSSDGFADPTHSVLLHLRGDLDKLAGKVEALSTAQPVTAAALETQLKVHTILPSLTFRVPNDCSTHANLFISHPAC
jgi:hypothetical protein